MEYRRQERNYYYAARESYFFNVVRFCSWYNLKIHTSWRTSLLSDTYNTEVTSIIRKEFWTHSVISKIISVTWLDWYYQILKGYKHRWMTIVWILVHQCMVWKTKNIIDTRRRSQQGYTQTDNKMNTSFVKWGLKCYDWICSFVNI